MRLFSRRKAETGIIALLLVALAGFAITYDGVPAAEVDLNDGGVWVTNEKLGLAGHFNYQSRVNDGGLDALAQNFDVSQEGNSVLLHDTQGDQAATIDTAALVLGSPIATAGLDYSHGKNTVLIADKKKGKVWASNLDDLSGFATSQEPLLEGVAEPRLVVGRDGVGYVVSKDGAVTAVKETEGRFVTEDAGTLAEGGLSADSQLTVAGSQVVAVEAGRVRTVERTVEVDAPITNSLAQLPSLQGGRVSIATDDALLTIPLGDGKPERIEVEKGKPAAPADVGGCVYGAWAGSGSYTRNCDVGGEDLNDTNETLAKASSAVFRISRDIVVINDTSGNVYLPDEGMVVINDWDKIKSQVEQETTDEEESDEETREETFVENAEQKPPVARDDEFGARQGTTTTLPVLLNDVDPDGDVLTVRLVNVPEGVKVTLGRDDRTAQIFLPPGASGPVSFTYQAFDGEDESNTATVKVTPRPDGVNEAPKRERDNAVNMTEQATVQYSVLPDWVDPDGDSMYLVDAKGDAGMAVTFRQDGHLSLRDLGTAGAGRREVKVTVSDGKQKSTGTIRLQVSPGATNLPPVANADHYVVNLGEQVVLRPLSNDTDPNGAPLRLAEMASPAPDETLEVDYEQASALFSSTKEGSHEITYAVSDGPNSAKGKIRIDVKDPGKAANVPSAQNDLALLPDNASATVNVLDNDTDPAGGVLAIQSLSIDEGSGLTVEVKDHSVLRISAQSQLEAPRTFSYTVSNGKESATARVLVLPQPPQQTNQPPVTVDDSTVVRTGDIVAIPVLDNDYSPTDLELSVDPEIQVRGDEGLGEAFVSGNLVRFRAGDKEGSTSLVYTTVDSAGNRASAKIELTVRDFDSGNQKPAPRPVKARVFAGSSTQVAVPLDGVDPDGDSVELAEGGSQGPKLGSVKIEAGYLVYTASNGAGGTDSFTYQVKDRFGMTGEARIQVGVVPPPATNQLPVAVADQVTLRPGQDVEIPVTQNDVDPDGDKITIIDGSAKPLEPWKGELSIAGQDVKLTTPDEPGTYQFSYDITDEGGTPVTGYATIIVDPDAPLLHPIAADDRVLASDVAGKSEVEVPVLDNDVDPDGSRDDLTVEVEGAARVNDGKIVVPVDDEPQVVLYTIVDSDGLSAKAAIFVPGSAKQPPALKPDKVPAKVKGGETLRVDFNEYVLTRPGHTAKLTSVESVVAGAGGSTTKANQGLKIVGDTAIEFTPDAKFYGPTSLTFEVHDGSSLDDPRGLRSRLSLPIEVTSSGRFPPELRPAPVEIAPGESPLAVNLRDMVNDPDPGDNEKMNYSLVSAPSGIDVEMAGQEMRVSTDAKTKPGTAGNAVIRVHDGSTDPVEMRVPVTVVNSTRPLITATELKQSEGRVGKPSVFDLNQALTNPFADRGGEITISNATVRRGSARASVNEMNLTVTPNEVGTVVVNYTATDAANRRVTGQVSLNVKDRPLAPQNLTAKSDVSRTVELAWTQGDLRGGKLDHFEVKWRGGSQNCGESTNCRITGLDNDTEYQFTVHQVTEAGESPASNTASARPDVKPNRPAVPSTKFGDRQIEVSWPATSVPDGGSPVTRYVLEVSPAVNGVTSFSVTSTSRVVTGLANGTAYRFRIQAINKYAENNVARQAEYLWSGWSAPEIPAGAPTGQAAPRVVKDKAAAGVNPRANVTWSAPANANGDRSFRYQLRERGTSTVLYDGTGTSATVNMNVSSEDKTFEVRSTNKSGLWSDFSPASNAVRAFQPPGAPTRFSLTPTGQPNQVRFNFSAGAANGAKAGELSYRWSAGGGSGTVTNGQVVTSSVFVNGRDVQVSLVPIARINGETAQGSAATATVNAYGPPAAPTISASGAHRKVNFNWNADTNSGGRPSTVKLSNGASGASGSTGVDTGYGSQVCVTATVTNSQGQSSSTQACGSSWAAPYAKSVAGPQVTCSPGFKQQCFEYHLELERFPPNATIHCVIKNDHMVNNQHPYLIGDLQTDGNGYVKARLKKYTQSNTVAFGQDETASCSPR